MTGSKWSFSELAYDAKFLPPVTPVDSWEHLLLKSCPEGDAGVCWLSWVSQQYMFLTRLHRVSHWAGPAAGKEHWAQRSGHGWDGGKDPQHGSFHLRWCFHLEDNRICQKASGGNNRPLSCDLLSRLLPTNLQNCTNICVSAGCGICSGVLSRGDAGHSDVLLFCPHFLVEPEPLSFSPMLKKPAAKRCAVLIAEDLFNFS